MLHLQKLVLLVLCAGTVFSAVVHAQQDTSKCFEVHHLDFFGLGDSVKPNWSNDQLDKLIESPDGTYRQDLAFLTPAIVYQLSELYPGCSGDDAERRDKLIRLYASIFKLNFSDIQNLPVESRFTLIRNDFYQRIQDDRQLPKMIYSMDDGPLYGELVKRAPTAGLLTALNTKFGQVLINKFRSKLYVSATSSNGRPMWSRILTGVVPERYLKTANVSQARVEESSLATVVSLPVDGERLSLYLRPNGRFIFYRHSW